MQVNKILSVDNHNLTTQKKQNNPSFGRLIVENSVPTEFVRELVNNQEIKQLVRLCDNIGINLRAKLYWKMYDGATRDRASFELLNDKRYKKQLHMATVLLLRGYNNEEVLHSIKNLPEGTAIRRFEGYCKCLYPQKSRSNYNLTPEDKERQNAFEEVENFNKSLSNYKKETETPKKKSFWEKLSDLF